MQLWESGSFLQGPPEIPQASQGDSSVQANTWMKGEGLTLDRPRSPPLGCWTVCEDHAAPEALLAQQIQPQIGSTCGFAGVTYGSLDSGSVSMTILAACSSSSCRTASSAALQASSSASRAASRCSCRSLYRNSNNSAIISVTFPPSCFTADFQP